MCFSIKMLEPVICRVVRRKFSPFIKYLSWSKPNKTRTNITISTLVYDQYNKRQEDIHTKTYTFPCFELSRRWQYKNILTTLLHIDIWVLFKFAIATILLPKWWMESSLLQWMQRITQQHRKTCNWYPPHGSQSYINGVSGCVHRLTEAYYEAHWNLL